MSEWSERKQEIEERRQFDLLCSWTKATENDLPDIYHLVSRHILLCSFEGAN